jgi:hypothetical protein
MPLPITDSDWAAHMMANVRTPCRGGAVPYLPLLPKQRLNRVRQTLFEELVKTRAEAATARTELEAVSKARDQAEAELGRLKQEMTSGISTTLPPNVNALAASRPTVTSLDNPQPKKATPRRLDFRSRTAMAALT